MKDVTELLIAFVIGLIIGGVAIGGCTATNAKTEAVKNGHASFVLTDPLQRAAIFQWNTNCNQGRANP